MCGVPDTSCCSAPSPPRVAGSTSRPTFSKGAATLDTTATVLTVAVPVAVFVVALYAIGSVFLRQRDPFHLVLLAGTAGVLVLAMVFAELGMNVSWCLVVLMLAPAVTVLGYETVGHRHLARRWHGTDSCDRVDARVERDTSLLLAK